MGPAYARNVGAPAGDRVGRLRSATPTTSWPPAGSRRWATALRTEAFACGPIDIVALNPPWLADVAGHHGHHGRGGLRGPLPVRELVQPGDPARDRFLDANGFDEDLLAGEDVDLSMRLYCAGVALAYVPDALVRYRYRPTLRSTFDRAVAYGRARPLIAERWRARRRGEDVSRWRGRAQLRVARAPRAAARRPVPGGRAGSGSRASSLGTVAGSRRVRRLYL